MIMLGALISMFAISRNLVVSMVVLFAAGIALIIVFALNSSLVQIYVTDGLRGRVLSVYNVAFRGGMPIGSVFAGSDQADVRAGHHCGKRCFGVCVRALLFAGRTQSGEDVTLQRRCGTQPKADGSLCQDSEYPDDFYNGGVRMLKRLFIAPVNIRPSCLR